MKLFVNPDDSFSLTCQVSEGKDGRLLVSEASGPKNEGPTEVHTLRFKYPSAKDNTIIVDSSLAVVDGQLTFKSSALRLQRLICLLKSWEFKDEKGNSIALNEKTIGELHPDLFVYISQELERLLGVV